MRLFRLIVCLVVMSSPTVALAATPAAYIYISTSAGVRAYCVASNGELTLLSGSPFAVKGSIVAANGSYLISEEPSWLHSYELESKGTINEPEVSSINISKYTGAKCGSASGAVLNRAGKLVYVSNNGPVFPADSSDEPCNAFQTYAIAKDGALSFVGASVFDQGGNGLGGALALTLPVVAANDKFAYGAETYPDNDDSDCELYPQLYSIGNQGILEPDNSPSVVNPPLPSNPDYFSYYPAGPAAADSSNHFAIVIYPSANDCEDVNVTGPLQLASYTQDSHGNLTSTNTAKDMPVGGGYYTSPLSMSPSGKLLAASNGGTNIQLFHFNGAEPITPFTQIVGASGYMSQLAWDSDDHLFAINGASGKLHVFTVSSKGAVEAKGSPYSIDANPTDPIVVK
jgi:hypothetical protein